MDQETIPLDIIEKNINKFVEAGIEIKVLHNNHEGPGAARNHGIFSTSKPWIAFLDADDTWKPDKLKKIKKLIKREQKINFMLHWEEYIHADGYVTTLEHGKNYNEKISIAQQLYRNNFMSTSAVVCHRSLLEKYGGFDVFLPNGQDYDLWLKMSPEINIKIIPEILGSYIEESTSITARPYYFRIKSDLKIALRHMDKGSFRIFISKIIRVLISKQWFYTFRNSLQNKTRHSN